jgi:hypothetical protein
LIEATATINLYHAPNNVSCHCIKRHLFVSYKEKVSTNPYHTNGGDLMMMIINARDLARMSPSLRAELQKLMFGDAANAQCSEEDWREDENIAHFDFANEGFPPELWIGSADEILETKSVIDITTEQAKSLLANLSAKSIETLKLFATEPTVRLDQLVGENYPYANFGELKRSFVGAVNRRLRTVTRNRMAVLFRKVATNIEGGGDEIAVRPLTAAALRDAFSLKHESLPAVNIRGNEYSIPRHRD